MRLARENRGWGNLKIAGERAKLGIEISDETVADILDDMASRAPQNGAVLQAGAIL